MSNQDQIRLAEITADIVDDEQFLSHQISYLGKVANGTVFYPYGFHANAAPGSWALMFSMEGHPDNRALLVSEPKIRPTLKPGEVALYTPLMPDLIITLLENGELSIKSPVKVVVEAPEIELKGSVKVFVEAPEIELKGSVTVTGNLTVDGNTALSTTVTSGTKDISNTHKHEGSPTVPALAAGLADTGAVV